MNTETDLTRQQMQAMADYLMLQYGTVLFLKLAYLALFLVLLGILFGGRRLALGFLFLIGALAAGLGLAYSPTTQTKTPGNACSRWVGRVIRRSTGETKIASFESAPV
jgi:hypothetical protein